MGLGVGLGLLSEGIWLADEGWALVGNEGRGLGWALGSVEGWGLGWVKGWVLR